MLGFFLNTLQLRSSLLSPSWVVIPCVRDLRYFTGSNLGAYLDRPASFPSRSVGHLVSLPTTPPKPPKISRDPPSTGRTKAITQALEHTYLSPSSKTHPDFIIIENSCWYSILEKGKEKTPQPKLQPQRPGLATGSQVSWSTFCNHLILTSSIVN